MLQEGGREGGKSAAVVAHDRRPAEGGTQQAFNHLFGPFTPKLALIPDKNQPLLFTCVLPRLAPPPQSHCDWLWSSRTRAAEPRGDQKMWVLVGPSTRSSWV